MSNFPLILRSDKMPCGALLLVDYIPSYEALLAAADDADRASIAGFSSPSRCRERLAWRELLRRELRMPVAVSYLPSGRPLLQGSAFQYISVSHCADMVAVVLSDARCGVDVERLDRRFAAVAERYISDEELSLVHSDYERAVIWAAKECLYKMTHCEGLDLKEHIRIEAIDGATSLVRGVVRHHDKELLRCELHLLQPDTEHILLYAF
ncbi:MAG: 4'-phosphopantetheinyl transferase superfamily protein [Alistipes sp.]|nr:4'-phosphopantetheinyl transferase superfamily protein [Alistipes sp.]